MIRTVALSAGAVLVAALVVLTYSPFLDVDRVTVAGASQTAPELVRRASGVDHGDLMLDLDEDEVRKEVAELPWVRRVSVARSFPGTVRLEVTERRPIAYAERRGDDRYALIDANGRLLEERDGAPPGLVRLAGAAAGEPGDTLADLEPALTVAAALDGPMRLYVGAIHRRAGDLELELRNEAGWVRLGPPRAVSEKLTAIKAVLATQPKGCPTIDVRVPRAPVLTAERRCA